MNKDDEIGIVIQYYFSLGNRLLDKLLHLFTEIYDHRYHREDEHRKKEGGHELTNDIFIEYL